MSTKKKANIVIEFLLTVTESSILAQQVEEEKYS
jgi:hypothetical protein